MLLSDITLQTDGSESTTNSSTDSQLNQFSRMDHTKEIGHVLPLSMLKDPGQFAQITS